MWQPRRLTTLWASTSSYRDSFAFFFTTVTALRTQILRGQAQSIRPHISQVVTEPCLGSIHDIGAILPCGLQVTGQNTVTFPNNATRLWGTSVRTQQQRSRFTTMYQTCRGQRFRLTYPGNCSCPNSVNHYRPTDKKRH
jgi:hypothetical protein